MPGDLPSGWWLLDAFGYVRPDELALRPGAVWRVADPTAVRFVRDADAGDDATVHLEAWLAGSLVAR